MQDESSYDYYQRFSIIAKLINNGVNSEELKDQRRI